MLRDNTRAEESPMHDVTTHFWEKAVDGALVTDRAGFVVWANPAAAMMFGYTSPGKMRTLPLSQLVPLDDRQELEEDFDALSGDLHVHRLCRFQNINGRTFDSMLEAVRGNGDCYFFTIRNTERNPKIKVQTETSNEHVPPRVEKMFSPPDDEQPIINVTPNGRIRVGGNTNGSSDDLLSFTKRIIREFDRLREDISNVMQHMMKLQTLQETSQRDQEKIERRVERLEERRNDCSTCRTTASVEGLVRRVSRIEDTMERERHRTEDKIERSREVPLFERKIEKLEDQNTQAWVFLQSKWALLAGAIGLIGIVGALVTMFMAIF